MRSYDLYGTNFQGLDEVRAALEALLGEKFIAHDSAYFGEYYSLTIGDGTISIKSNVDPEGGEPLEDEFPDEPIVVHVDEVSDARAIRELMSNSQGQFVLLRHEEI